MATASRCLSCLIRARVNASPKAFRTRRKPNTQWPKCRSFASTPSRRKDKDWEHGYQNQSFDRDIKPSAKTDRSAEKQLADEKRSRRTGGEELVNDGLGNASSGVGDEEMTRAMRVVEKLRAGTALSEEDDVFVQESLGGAQENLRGGLSSVLDQDLEQPQRLMEGMGSFIPINATESPNVFDRFSAAEQEELNALIEEAGGMKEDTPVEEQQEDDEDNRAILEELKYEMMQKPKEPRYRRGFFDVYEDNEELTGPDPVPDSDDISSTAHMQLEQLREMREFARCIVWDMPLLHRYAKPFEPPTATQPLRFRYSSFMGEEHPAARKVSVSFNPQKLDESLTQVQIDKVIKILGPRYDPSKKEATMSCDLHATLAQNKRWLGDQIEKIIDECKNGKDTFEDVPFDFRHHKPKKVKHRFPEEWKMTLERRAMLEAKHQKLLDDQLLMLEEGKEVDGEDIIESVKARDTMREPIGVPVSGEPIRRRTTLSKSDSFSGLMSRPSTQG